MPFDRDKMKAIRKEKGIDLAYLGNGLSYFAARSAELGARPDPRISTVEKIAKGLGVPIEALLSEHVAPPEKKPVKRKRRKKKAKKEAVTDAG